MARKGYKTATFTLPDGTRKYVYAKTQEELDEKVFDLKLQMKMGVNLKDTITVGELIKMWFTTEVEPNVRNNTAANTKCILNKHLMPMVAQYVAKDVTPVQVKMWLNETGKLNKNAAKTCLRALRNAFSLAEENGLIYKSPVLSRYKAGGTEFKKREQVYIDGAKIGEGSHDHHAADEQVLRAVVSQLTDFKQVAGQPGEDGAGFVIVEEGVGQLLQMGEQVAAHLLLHLHADDMAVVLDEVVEQHTDDVQTQNHQAGNNDLIIEPVGDQIVEHFIGHHGVDHADDGDHQRCQHVQGEHELMRLVVSNKSFQHLRSSLYCLLLRPVLQPTVSAASQSGPRLWQLSGFSRVRSRILSAIWASLSLSSR